jgi:hypothetical protein
MMKMQGKKPNQKRAWFLEDLLSSKVYTGECCADCAGRLLWRHALSAESRTERYLEHRAGSAGPILSDEFAASYQGASWACRS